MYMNGAGPHAVERAHGLGQIDSLVRNRLVHARPRLDMRSVRWSQDVKSFCFWNSKMLKKIGEPAPPKGIKLKLFRAPIYLYHMKLGFLLGERFICLGHWGRVSGELRETVIEVIDHDKANGKLYSASGYGKKSQWFRNISKNGDVLITIKNREYKATARVVSEKEAEEILLRYARSHPNSIRGVARLSGYKIDANDQDIIEFSKIVRIVEFKLIT